VAVVDRKADRSDDWKGGYCKRNRDVATARGAEITEGAEGAVQVIPNSHHVAHRKRLNSVFLLNPVVKSQVYG
jgi:hypothetical protein